MVLPPSIVLILGADLSHLNDLTIPIMQQGGAFHFTNKLLVLFKLSFWEICFFLLLSLALFLETHAVG